MEKHMTALYCCFGKKKEGGRNSIRTGLISPSPRACYQVFLQNETEYCKALVWRGSSCQMYDTCTKAGLSLHIFSCNLNVLQTNSPKVWNSSFFQHIETPVFSLKKRTHVIFCVRLLFLSCIKREPGMEMNQRGTSHLCYGCRCTWRWNFAGTQLCLSQSLYKRMGCKIRITTFKNSHCECSSAQLIFEREKFFFRNYQIRRKCNFRIILRKLQQCVAEQIAFNNSLVGLFIAGSGWRLEISFSRSLQPGL